MSLAPGARFGSFEVLAALGAGGMGEVYRARDSRLKRDVAIKILPDAFALDDERLLRFQREAELLASLNHPNIAAIYGLEDSGSVRGLVLELVEGATLAERLEHGPVPVAEAMTIAAQIALALEAAHERGIIHRDLKPANVKLAPDGMVKVLDFGLAKALDRGAAANAGSNPLEHSPTVTSGGTAAGVLLGTVAYMSPEQARGLALDARTDIWAFGCVLYELLTARPAFPGATVADILAAIVQREPDWGALPAGTPESARRVLRRCLEKDLKRRLRHIGDARLELEDMTPVTPSAPPVRRQPGWLGWAAAAALVVAAGAMVISLLGAGGPAPSDAPIVARFVRLTTGSAHESAPAISPDGKWVAYLSNTRGGATDVWVKNVAGGDPVNLTAAANLSLQTQSDIGGLSISPDGATITFDAGVPQTGVPAFTAWAIPAPLGGMPRKLLTRGRAVQWSRDGRKIVYVMPGSSAGDALWVADADGGNAREVAPRHGGVHKHWAAWSADGRYIYFNSSYSTFNYEGGEIYRLPSDGGSAEPVVTTARRAAYAAPMPDGSGIIYAANPDTDDAGLWWKSLQHTTAAPERLTTGIGEYVEPYISADGTRVACTLLEKGQALVRLSLSSPGEARRTSLTNGFTGDLDPAMAPSGDRLVFSSARGGNRNLWTSRHDGSDPRPLTSGVATDDRPAYSPDGQRVAFVSNRGGRRGIWIIDAEGGAARLLAAADVLDTISWSRDGSKIVFAVPGEEPHLESVGVADGVVRPVKTPGAAAAPAWSPAADVIAYIEARPVTVGVQVSQHVAFVDADGNPLFAPVAISRAGNGAPTWDRTGQRLAIIGNSGAVASGIWTLVPQDATSLRQVVEFPQDVRLRGLTWTPDGQSLIVGEFRRTGDIVLFDLIRR